jgi:hypothetical protein
VTTSAQLETLGHEEAAEEEEESTQNDSLIQAKKKEVKSCNKNVEHKYLK